MSDYEYYAALTKQGTDPREAARLTDLRIAYRSAKRRLEKKNTRREPTEREVDAIFWAM